jgi:hypothetical protein
MNKHIYCNIIDSVFQIISSRLPTHLASHYIDDKALIRMDNISVRGFNYWCMWVDYMRHFGRLQNLTLIRRETVINGNYVEVRGVARGNFKDNKTVENEIFVKFFLMTIKLLK